MINEKFHIFLDTSEYYAQNYDFEGEHTSSLIALKTLCQQEQVFLYIDKIIANEIRCDLIEEAKVQINILKDALLKRPKSAYLRIYNTDKADIRRQLHNINTETIYLNEFQNFIATSRAKVIDIDTVKASDVFKLYFHSDPPFSDDKKSEFPDAFSIGSLLNFVIEKKINMIVVSRDGDWKKALYGRERIQFKKSLNEALSYINQNLFVAEDCILEHRYKIDELLEDKIKGAEFYLSDEDGEVSEIKEVIFFEIEDINTLSIEHNVAIVSAVTHMEIELELSVFDEENSVWDNEDKIYLFEKYSSYSQTFDSWVYFEINLTFNNSVKDIKIEIENVNGNKPFSIDTLAIS